MKIIVIDSFDRDYVWDKLIAENVPKGYGEKIVKLLNDNTPDLDADYFILTEDDYKLYTFEP